LTLGKEGDLSPLSQKSALQIRLFSIKYGWKIRQRGPMRVADAQTGRPFYVAFQIIGIIFIIY
jgi:hypothetical protein